MNKLVEAIHLRKEYIYRKNFFSPKVIAKALDYASLEILENEILGLVGGRGSGKTSMGELIAGLSAPDYGRIEFRGKDLCRMKEREIRGKIQIVFQDVAGHIDSRLTIGKTIEESIDCCKKIKKKLEPLGMMELFEMVELRPSLVTCSIDQLDEIDVKKVGIALAVLWRPQLIVLDEPVDGIDASIRGQVIDILQKIREIYGTSYLFISKDLNAAKKICDRIAIIHNGRIVEVGQAKTIMENPESEYVKQFVESIL